MGSLFGYLMGALLIVIGLATTFLAPRVGPNPFFGVRTGYSFANRQVWNQSNRVGGWLMAGVGGLLVGLTAVLQALGVSAATATVVLTTALMVTLLGAMVWLVWYTRRLALGSPGAVTLAPVHLDGRMLAPSLAAWGVLAAVMLAVYPTLPAILATHFNAAGEPDGWSSRLSFAILYTGLGLLLALIPVIVALVARYEPVIGLSRLAGWRVEPRDGVVLTSWSMALTNLFLVVVLLDVVWFSWYGIHLFAPGPLVLIATVLLVGGILALFFRYARRTSA